MIGIYWYIYNVYIYICMDWRMKNRVKNVIRLGKMGTGCWKFMVEDMPSILWTLCLDCITVMVGFHWSIIHIYIYIYIYTYIYIYIHIYIHNYTYYRYTFKYLSPHFAGTWLFNRHEATEIGKNARHGVLSWCGLLRIQDDFKRKISETRQAMPWVIESRNSWDSWLPTSLSP